LQLRIFFKTFPETSKCPSCGQIGRIRRSRTRNLFEMILKSTNFFGIYKCRDCGWRGYLKRFTFNYYSLITASFYLLLIFSVAYIITKVLKKNFGE
jgi:hypothetical protein